MTRTNTAIYKNYAEMMGSMGQQRNEGGMGQQGNEGGMGQQGSWLLNANGKVWRAR